MVLDGVSEDIEPRLVRTWNDEDGRRIEDFVLHGEEAIPFVVLSGGATGPKPVVFWQHGATGSRLANLGIMHRLCDAGYLNVSVDQRGHGDRERTMPPIAGGEEPRFEERIIYIACGTARDIPLVLDYLETRPDADADRIGWVGGSLGGLVGTILATRESRIKAMVSVIAGGALRMLAEHWAKGEMLREETIGLLDEYDPIRHVDRLFPTAILQLNGGIDGLCIPEAAQAFHDAALPYYARDPDRLKLVIDPDAGHAVTTQGEEAALEWLERYL